ncbi:MAG: S41 family peptidase [Rhodospirillaceae bacterium]|nr:S41 family peptidase [Rhodospirillaceae bacterium]
MKRSLRLAAAAAALVYVSPLAFADTAKNADTYRQLNLFGDVFERVRSDYVQEVSDQELIEAAINGMLTHLDPHSSYLDAKSFQDMQVQTKGEFGGLGIEVTMENGFVKVVSPIDDTPAARAGIRPGDFIIQLDGQSVQGMTLNEAVDKMRGPVNSKITLTIQRGTEEPFDVSLTRDIIKIQSVRSRLEGDVGYLRITSFSEQTAPGVEAAVKKLQDEAKGKMIGLVLDLRNNPGGLLDQAVAVADFFLDKGEIVSTRGRDPDQAQRFNAQPGDILKGLPMVVLINSGSASASEIVAGALQDHHRAVLMGTTSFGKGSVQTIIPIPGYGAIRLTTARYYTPSGRSIQAKGIEPDIHVEQARLQVIEEPKGRHEAALPGALDNPDESGPAQAPTPQEDQSPAPRPGATAPGASTPNQGAQGTPTPGTPGPAGAAPGQQGASPAPILPGEPGDYQLSRAIDLLRGVSLFQSAQRDAN